MYKIERFTAEIGIDEFIKKYYQGEKILQKCRECSGFAKAWSCPDFDFDTEEYWKQFDVYEVICDKISMEGVQTPQEAEQRLYKEKPRFNKEMLALEAATPDSRALYAEECDECKECARLIGKPCRLPHIMRYSIESLGGCGVALVEDLFGFSPVWSDGTSIPDYYILLGGLLKQAPKK